MASSSNFITYIPQKNLKITDKYLDNQRYVAEVNAISHQIYFEFERLTMYEEGWDIS